MWSGGLKREPPDHASEGSGPNVPAPPRERDNLGYTASTKSAGRRHFLPVRDMPIFASWRSIPSPERESAATISGSDAPT